MRRCLSAAVAIVLATGIVALGQTPRRAGTGAPGSTVQAPGSTVQAPGSTVQLPTLSSFSSSTSVLVPDSGGAALGGVRRVSASSGGATAQAVQSGVHAQIHDMAAMEKEVLDRAAAAAPPGPATAAALPGSRASSAERPAMSVAEARRAHDTEAQAARGQASVWFERARAAEDEGRLAAARVYYQMACRRADGPMRESIRARLETLGKRR